jgi:hypothetical protein
MDPVAWKSSPRSIGFDADKNGQSRKAQHKIPIPPEVKVGFAWNESTL